jgi:sporadic carbohydrate cluster protein (TIGR04323 family)
MSTGAKPEDGAPADTTPSLANRQRAGLQGYVTHQSFKGMRMPATVQNLVMRDYITRAGAQLRLSVGEYYFDNCYVQLYSMLRKLDELEGIVMCSLFMLPSDPAKRRWIYDRFLESGAALHCVFEGLVIKDEETMQRAEDLLQMNAALDVAPTTIDPALLPPIDGVDTFT